MQRIIIKSFGPIECAEIDISQVVILIGEQASGKSTIGKLIYFFKSLKEDFFGSIYQNSNSNKDFRLSLIKSVQSKFHLYFGSINHLPAFSIKYYYSVRNNKYLELIKENDDGHFLKVSFAKTFYQSIGKELKEIVKTLQQPTTSSSLYEIRAKETEKAKYLNRLVGILNRLFEDDKTSLYVPAGRNITVSYSNQFKFLFFGELSVEFNKILDNLNQDAYSTEHSVDMHLMKEYLKETEGLIDKFENSDFKTQIEKKKQFNERTNENLLLYANHIIENILKGEYVKDSYGEKIYYDRENNGYVHLHNASSGQQEVIRILQDLFVILLEKKNVFRVIEEPEAHLYPVAQKNIIDLVATIINNTKSQIIITTHSPYILSVFNNLLYSKRVSLQAKSKTKEISEIIPEYSQLNPNDFRAYSLKNISKTYIEDNLPYCQSIFDEKTGMISQNYLDEVSEELGEDFDELYNIHKQSI